MAVEGSQPLKVSYPASADLITGSTINSVAGINQYLFVKLASTNSSSHFAIGQLVICGADDPKVIGVNQTHLKSTSSAGAMCEVVVVGRTKVQVDAAITINTHFFVGIGTNGGAKGVAASTGGAKVLVGPYMPSNFDTGSHAVGDVASTYVNCLTPILTGA